MKIRIINQYDWERHYKIDKTIIRVGSQISCDVQLPDKDLPPLVLQMVQGGENNRSYNMRVFADNVLLTRGDQNFPASKMTPYEVLDGDKLTFGEYRMIINLDTEDSRIRRSEHMEAELFLTRRELTTDSPINGFLHLKNIGTEKPCQFRMTIKGFPDECLRSSPLPYLYPGGNGSVGFLISHLQTRPDPGFHTVSIILSAPEEYFGETLEFNQDIYVTPVFRNEFILEDDSAQLENTGLEVPEGEGPIPVAPAPVKLTESAVMNEPDTQSKEEETEDPGTKPLIVVGGKMDADKEFFSSPDDVTEPERPAGKRSRPKNLVTIHKNDQNTWDIFENSDTGDLSDTGEDFRQNQDRPVAPPPKCKKKDEAPAEKTPSAEEKAEAPAPKKKKAKAGKEKTAPDKEEAKDIPPKTEAEPEKPAFPAEEKAPAEPHPEKADDASETKPKEAVLPEAPAEAKEETAPAAEALPEQPVPETKDISAEALTAEETVIPESDLLKDSFEEKAAGEALEEINRDEALSEESRSIPSEAVKLPEGPDVNSEGTGIPDVPYSADTAAAPEIPAEEEKEAAAVPAEMPAETAEKKEPEGEIKQETPKPEAPAEEEKEAVTAPAEMPAKTAEKKEPERETKQDAPKPKAPAEEQKEAAAVPAKMSSETAGKREPERETKQDAPKPKAEASEPEPEAKGEAEKKPSRRESIKNIHVVSGNDFDWFDSEAAAAQSEPAQPKNQKPRVVKGGDFDD